MNEFENLSRKTILVNGATGLIGGNLVKRLVQYPDLKIIVLGRSEQKIKAAFSDFLGNSNFSYVVADVNAPLPPIPGLDVIFHAAALISRDAIAQSPVDVIAPSLFGLKNLMELMLYQKNDPSHCRFVVFSSTTVYGNNTNGDILVSEPDTCMANSLDSVNSPYSESKRMSEVLARAYAKQYGLDVVIARPSWVYGNSPFPNLGTAVFEFVKKALEGEDIILNGEGFPRRDNIHVNDVVAGLLTLLEKGETGHSYNISTSKDLGNFAAIDEIAELIAKIARDKFNHRTKVVYLKGNSKNREPGIVCDNRKLKALGWEPNVNLEKGLCQIMTV